MKTVAAVGLCHQWKHLLLNGLQHKCQLGLSLHISY